MSTWNKKQTCKLIDLYQRYRILYDQKDPDYLIRRKRDQNLEIVCKSLQNIRPGTTIPDIKQKIKTIRSQYSREKIRVQTEEDYVPALWFYDDLQFLDPFIERKTIKTEFPVVHNTHQTSPKKPTHYETNLSTSETSLAFENCGVSFDKQRNKTNFQSQKFNNKKKFIDLYEEAIFSNLDEYGQSLDIEPDTEQQTNQELVPEEEFDPEQHQEPEYQSEPQPRNIKNKADAFCKYMCSELKSIEDDDVFEDTKWEILKLVREAHKKDRSILRFIE